MPKILGFRTNKETKKVYPIGGGAPINLVIKPTGLSPKKRLQALYLVPKQKAREAIDEQKRGRQIKKQDLEKRKRQAKSQAESQKNRQEINKLIAIENARSGLGFSKLQKRGLIVRDIEQEIRDKPILPARTSFIGKSGFAQSVIVDESGIPKMPRKAEDESALAGLVPDAGKKAPFKKEGEHEKSLRQFNKEFDEREKRIIENLNKQRSDLRMLGEKAEKQTLNQKRVFIDQLEQELAELKRTRRDILQKANRSPRGSLPAGYVPPVEPEPESPRDSSSQPIQEPQETSQPTSTPKEKIKKHSKYQTDPKKKKKLSEEEKAKKIETEAVIEFLKEQKRATAQEQAQLKGELETELTDQEIARLNIESETKSETGSDAGSISRALIKDEGGIRYL